MEEGFDELAFIMSHGRKNNSHWRHESGCGDESDITHDKQKR
jgi:hypothetical protein